jgi:hypothetical protein
MTADGETTPATWTSRMQHWREYARSLGRSMLDNPIRTLAILASLALAIEFAQYRPEIFRGGHALSEFVRNITYGLIAAVVFEWLIVQIPEQRRRRAAYEANKIDFEVLVSSGSLIASDYRHFNPPNLPEFDSWDRQSVRQTALAIAVSNPSMFAPDRAHILKTTIMGVQVALDGIRLSQSFLDPDVALVIAKFPATTGFSQLQVDVDINGNSSPGRDSIIVWELLEASRRLYAALHKHAPYLSLDLESATIAEGYRGEILKVRKSDLVKPGA